MAFIDQLKELETSRAKLALLEQSLMKDREQALAALPASFGYSNVNDFIKALKAAKGKGPKAPKGPKGPKAPKAPKGPKGPKGKRTRLTPEGKLAIIAAAQAGTKTGAEIAKEFGVSIATIHNLKKSAGLVKARA